MYVLPKPFSYQWPSKLLNLPKLQSVVERGLSIQYFKQVLLELVVELRLCHLNLLLLHDLSHIDPIDFNCPFALSYMKPTRVFVNHGWFLFKSAFSPLFSQLRCSYVIFEVLWEKGVRVLSIDVFKPSKNLCSLSGDDRVMDRLIDDFLLSL